MFVCVEWVLEVRDKIKTEEQKANQAATRSATRRSRDRIAMLRDATKEGTVVLFATACTERKHCKQSESRYNKSEECACHD